IAPRSAAVLGRATSADLGQPRIKHAWLGIAEPLDLDRVLPAIAEVVEVDELLCSDIFENVGEPGLARIEEVTFPAGKRIGRAPANIAGTQLIEMAVGPAHG